MTQLHSAGNLTSLLSFLLHDLLLLCSFLLCHHPLILAYFLLLSPYLLKLIFFLSPLLFSTSLLLLALLTVPTQLCDPPPSAIAFPGSTCGAVLDILHVGLIPDEAKACVTEQLCSMLLAGGDHFSCSERRLAKEEQSIGTPTPPCRTEHNRRPSGILRRDNSVVRKEKEWKRTLACKLFEERMTYKLCEDRKAVEGAEDMDLLWEAYEADAQTVDRPRRKEKRGRKAGEKEEEEEVEYDEVGMLGRLCCLKALRFSAGKMNLGAGKPSLVKISMALKGMNLFHTAGKRSGKSSKF